MFANLLALISRRPAPGAELAFVREVSVRAPVRRDPRTLRFILGCWALIAVKHGLVIWAVWRYPVPFHQLWVNFPTWLLGVLATGIYLGRR